MVSLFDYLDVQLKGSGSSAGVQSRKFPSPVVDVGVGPAGLRHHGAGHRES